MRRALIAGALAALVATSVAAAAVAKPMGLATAAKTCTNASIGVAVPATGPAASIGQEQLHWAEFALANYNKVHKTNYKMIVGDTQLPNVSAAIGVARQFASNKKVVAVVGPAGSQEVQAFGPSMTKARIAYISMSATRDDLTDGTRPTFFRVVGSDDAQGATDARYSVNTLKAKKVYVISDQTSYSTGLAATFAKTSKNLGATVLFDSINQQQTDFSALADKIGNDVDLVFLPWQIATQAQTFAQQMKAKGKKAIIFGSDGVFSPSDFNQDNSYVSAFARDIHGTPGTAALVKAYEKKYGKFGTFGPPTYVAMQVAVGAVDKACQAGGATRKSVRSKVVATNLPKTILGQPIRFASNGDVIGGIFYIYRIVNGNYQLVFPK